MAKRWKRRDADPIGDYVEWTRHRYNPGHFLGGNLPPYLRRASLGPKGRRQAGRFIGVIAFLTLAGAVAGALFGWRWEAYATALLALLVAAAAVKMSRPNGEGEPPPANEPRRARRRRRPRT